MRAAAGKRAPPSLRPRTLTIGLATKKNSWELQGADSKYVGGRWVLGADSIVPQFQLTSHGAQTGTASPYALEVDSNGRPDFGQNVKTIQEKPVLKDFKQPNNGMEELLGATGGEGADLKEILEIIYNGFAIQESGATQKIREQIVQHGDGAEPH